MLLGPIVWVLTLAICYFFMGHYWWFPPPISEHGRAYDAQFMRTLCGDGCYFLLAQMALGWVIVKFRDRGGVARYFHGNNELEAVWTIGDRGAVPRAGADGDAHLGGVHFDEAPPDAMPIEVMAKQFAWSFRYPGPDGKFGRTDLKLVNDAAGNPFGVDDKDPAGKDDIISASLKVPVGQAHQAHHAVARRHPQLLRARAAHEAGYRAGHGNPAALPGGQDRASTKFRARSCAAWATSRCAPPCR